MSAFEEKELNQLADALAQLTPRPAHLDRDRVLFEAGKRSVRTNLFWPIATLVLGIAVCGLSVALFLRPEPQVRWIQPVPANGPAAATPTPAPMTTADLTVPMPPTGEPANTESNPANQILKAGARQDSAGQLKQLATAMHAYHADHKKLPPPASLSEQKKPLLSWRVHLLPYLEQDNLYKQFKLDEPWDSEHNKKLIPQMPRVYQSALARNNDEGKTIFLGPAGNGMIFQGPGGMALTQITDGVSNTILIVEANDDHAVFWTKPDDYRPDKKDPAAPLIRKDAKCFHAAMADGSVLRIPVTIQADTLWGLLTPSGGEVVELPR